MSDAVTRTRELLTKATPGPWEERRYHFMDGEWMESYVVPVEDGDLREEDGTCVVINTYAADGELIAAAPTLLAELADEVDRLQEESDEYAALMRRLGELLTGVANALNGPPPELASWSYHDLPEKAADAMAEVERLQALTTVDDAMVERAARAVYGVAFADAAVGWGMVNQSMRDTCRTLADAALEAALGVES